MSLWVKLRDGHGQSGRGRVTSRGEVITSLYEASTPVNKDLVDVNTAYNFFTPKIGNELVVTNVVVNASRSVSVLGALISVYEATTVSTATVSKLLFQFDLARQQIVSIPGLQVLVTEGRWLSAKTDSANVLITIAGYYRPV